MEALHEKQKELINKLAGLIRNYGKERKNDLSYYGKKIEQLDEY